MSTSEERRINDEAIDKLLSKRATAEPTRAPSIVPAIRLVSFESDKPFEAPMLSEKLLEFFSRQQGKLGQRQSPISSGEKLEKLEEEVVEIKQRLAFLESTNKAIALDNNWFEIVADITNLFTPITYVKEIYGTKHEGLCDLLFVHDSENPTSAGAEILERTFLLERRFPRIDFDYLVLQQGEVDQDELARRILVYSRR